MPLSTAAVAGALLHIKPTFDRNLEFFLFQFRYLILWKSGNANLELLSRSFTL
jgi:hypothetical protein